MTTKKPRAPRVLRHLPPPYQTMALREEAILRAAELVQKTANERPITDDVGSRYSEACNELVRAACAKVVGR